MEQVLDVYARPYAPSRPVVCLDETRKQLIREKREPFTTSDGTVHVDYEYDRAGVAVLYMVTEPLGSFREVLVRERQDRFNWARVVAHIAEDLSRRPSASRSCKTTSQRTRPKRSTRSSIRRGHGQS